MHQNNLDFELAESVGTYFQLDSRQMNVISDEVKNAVGQWNILASELGISRSEQELMSGAFR